VEEDLRKRRVKRWRTKALNSEEWASIIREAKAKLQGPYRYRKKKNYIMRNFGIYAFVGKVHFEDRE
jgi:hypothetical protein